ncbi:MAG: flagellar protein FlaG [Microvirga sp.]|nr:flagellar protein FlaG [Microvirga sp.]
MDFGGVSKPIPASAQNAVMRMDQTTASSMARTELPPEATVQRVRETAAVRLDTSSSARELAAVDQAMQRAVQRRLEIDDKTQDLVYRARDARSGEVVTQIPTEETLKLRAYLRSAAEAAQQKVGEDR